MTLLPIVGRELRVAARRKSTSRIRFWSAAAAMAGFGWLMLALGKTGAAGFAARVLFGTLTTTAFGLCLLAGVLLTADCLSVEKREGTLGLLFLTDLKGYDVVLGKFTALALNPFYALLAIFPIMAIPLLMGGVTGGEFWRMTLALANALFLSLATGIWLSALNRRARRAMGGTFGLLIFLAGGLPALAWLASLFHLAPGWLHVAWISPTSPFRGAKEMVYRGAPQQFWHSLLASHLLGWLFVALASLALPHCWQERPKTVSRWRAGGSGRRNKAPARWLDINPVLWLVGRDRLLAVAAWAIVLVCGAVVLVETFFGAELGEALFANFFISRPFAFLLKMLFAIETCRFFAHARRNGALEMLLCTPLTGREILQGQRLALKRIFMPPLVVFFGIWFLPLLADLFTRPSSAKLTLGLQWDWIFVPLVLGREAVGFLAIYWFGTWLALTAKKPQMAGPLTILWVLVLPLFFCMMDFVAYLLFIAWGASRLQQDFRWLVSREYQRAPAGPAPPAAMSRFPKPPVIHG